MMNPDSWTYSGLTLKTTAEYTDHPFPWGTGVNQIKWIGTDAARISAMTAASAALGDRAWGSDVAWPIPFKEAYTKILGTYFSMPALRMMVLAHSGTPPVGGEGR